MTKVREFMTGWESPDTHQMIPLVWSDRNKEGLRGTAKGKRFTPKLRPFDMLSEPNQRLKMFESAGRARHRRERHRHAAFPPQLRLRRGADPVLRHEPRRKRVRQVRSRHGRGAGDPGRRLLPLDRRQRLPAHGAQPARAGVQGVRREGLHQRDHLHDEARQRPELVGAVGAAVERQGDREALHLGRGSRGRHHHRARLFAISSASPASSRRKTSSRRCAPSTSSTRSPARPRGRRSSSRRTA